MDQSSTGPASSCGATGRFCGVRVDRVEGREMSSSFLRNPCASCARTRRTLLPIPLAGSGSGGGARIHPAACSLRRPGDGDGGGLRRPSGDRASHHRSSRGAPDADTIWSPSPFPGHFSTRGATPCRAMRCREARWNPWWHHVFTCWSRRRRERHPVSGPVSEHASAPGSAQGRRRRRSAPAPTGSRASRSARSRRLGRSPRPSRAPGRRGRRPLPAARCARAPSVGRAGRPRAPRHPGSSPKRTMLRPSS